MKGVVGCCRRPFFGGLAEVKEGLSRQLALLDCHRIDGILAPP